VKKGRLIQLKTPDLKQQMIETEFMNKEVFKEMFPDRGI
jgi:hypothetical protein